MWATGNAPSFNHGPKILWWQQERPTEYARIAKFVQPGAYVAMRLCGLTAESAFIDHSYLHFSGFADNAGHCWDQALCAQFGIDLEKLPRIVKPTARIGTLTAAMAAACGLPATTIVIAGCGDTTASFTYRVLYTDADGDAPLGGAPYLHILEHGGEINGSPFIMTFERGPYTTGALYTYKLRKRHRHRRY